MTRRLAIAKKLVIGTVALGSVALGTAGVAGADTTTTTAPKAAKHFNCARAPKVLARIQSTEAKIAAGLPTLNSAESKARQKGRTTRADRIQKRIRRMESPTFKARLDKRKAKIEAACNISAPTANSTSASSITI